jgi:hypothetical protein
VKGLRHRSKLHPQVIRLERELHGEEFGKFLCTFYTIGSKLVMHFWPYSADMAKSRLVSQSQLQKQGQGARIGQKGCLLIKHRSRSKRLFTTREYTTTRLWALRALCYWLCSKLLSLSPILCHDCNSWVLPLFLHKSPSGRCLSISCSYSSINPSPDLHLTQNSSSNKQKLSLRGAIHHGMIVISHHKGNRY